MKTGQRPSLHNKKSAINVDNMVGVIKKQTQASALEIDVPGDELEARFDEYWTQVKDILPPHLIKTATKGGYRVVSRKRAVVAAGGRKTFFAPVLVEIVGAYLQKQPKQALATLSVDLIETNDKHVIQALVYLEPEVTWKKVPGIDAPLVVKIPKQPPNWLNNVVTETIRARQEDSVILVPVPDEVTVPVDEQVVAVDCQSLIDGKVWAEGSFKNNKWPVNLKYFKQPEIYANLITAEKGKNKVFSFVLAPAFGADAGKTVEATLRINQIYNKDVPAIDDDLAKNYGWQTLDAWKTALTEETKAKFEEQKNKLVDANVMSALVNQEAVDIEPIPFNWMAEKAKEIYGTLRTRTSSEEDLLQQFVGASTTTGEAVTSKNTLLTFLGEKAAQSLIHDLVLRSWGQKTGVEGDTTLGNVDVYVAEVKKKLNSLIQVEEFEVSHQTPDVIPKVGV